MSYILDGSLRVPAKRALAERRGPGGGRYSKDRMTEMSLVYTDQETHLFGYLVNERTLQIVPIEQQLFYPAFGKDFLDFLADEAANRVKSMGSKQTASIETGNLANYFLSGAGRPILSEILEPLPWSSASVVFPTTTVCGVKILSCRIQITPDDLLEWDCQSTYLWLQEVLQDTLNLVGPLEKITKVYVLPKFLRMKSFMDLIKASLREINPRYYTTWPQGVLGASLINHSERSTTPVLALHNEAEEAIAAAARAALDA